MLYLCQINFFYFFLNSLLELKEKRKGKRKPKTYPDTRVVEKKRIHRSAINYPPENTSWNQVPTSHSFSRLSEHLLAVQQVM